MPYRIYSEIQFISSFVYFILLNHTSYMNQRFEIMFLSPVMCGRQLQNGSILYPSLYPQSLQCDFACFPAPCIQVVQAACFGQQKMLEVMLSLGLKRPFMLLFSLVIKPTLVWLECQLLVAPIVPGGISPITRHGKEAVPVQPAGLFDGRHMHRRDYPASPSAAELPC